MSGTMDRIRREAMEKYGHAAPAAPAEAFNHVLKVYANESDDRLMIEATNGIYGDGVRTGLTMGDLRAIAALLARAEEVESQRDRAEYIVERALNHGNHSVDADDLAEALGMEEAPWTP